MTPVLQEAVVREEVEEKMLTDQVLHLDNCFQQEVLATDSGGGGSEGVTPGCYQRAGGMG